MPRPARVRGRDAAAREGHRDALFRQLGASAAFQPDQKGERWERMIPVNGKPQPSTTQVFRAGLPGVANLPATVAPTGSKAGGLPVGVQIIGPQYGDLTTIGVAKWLEKGHRGSVVARGLSRDSGRQSGTMKLDVIPPRERASA